MNSNIWKIILGVTVGGFLLNAVIGLSVVALMQGALFDGAEPTAAEVDTPYIAGGTPVLPEIKKSSDLVEPLLLKERALLSLQLEGVLGYGTDGWQLRYNTKEDGIALRPDMASCLSVPFDACYRAAKLHRDAVFVNGDKRLYVRASYYRSKLFSGFERDEEKALHKKFKQRRWPLSMTTYADGEYLKNEWVALEPWNGFQLERLDNHGGKGAYFLKATLEGDGRIELAMLSNAPLDEVKAQLAAMDLDLLRAMVAPVPFGGLDSFAAYVADVLRERASRDRFTILPQEELRRKVAEMPATTRIEYASGLVRLAQRRGLSVFDYKILYHPMGPQGLQDTRDYLAGKITEDDSRFEVLETEHKRKLPIGSCLATNVEVLCNRDAETMRLALEVSTQAAAARQLDPQTPQDAYSEETFQAEMREIERQMETALHKLTQLRAGE